MNLLKTVFSLHVYYEEKLVGHAPGTYFIKGLWAYDLNFAEINILFAWKIIMSSCSNCTDATTTELLWPGHICDRII